MDRQQAIQAIQQIEAGLSALKRALQPERPAAAPRPKTNQPQLKPAYAESLPAEQLGPTPDWDNPEWPEAVPSRLIIPENGSDAEKRFRALQVVGMLDRNFSGTYCLDLGCGTGHVAAEMAEKATKVVGYDIKQYEHWKNISTVEFTTEKEQLQPGFHFILCYDVLDHLVMEQPADFFSWAGQLLSPGGTMMVRVHPWTSRHGSHSYETVNKAYIHLALTDEELAASGISVDCTQRFVRPLAAYESIFRRAELQIVDKRTIATDVEPFFDNIIDRINKVTWGGNITPEVAKKIMAIQFIDYTLQRI